MKKSLSILFLVVLMIQLCCPFVFGDMAVYPSPKESVAEIILECSILAFCIVGLVSVISLFFFLYYYLRKKEISGEFNEVEEIIEELNSENNIVVDKEIIEEELNKESPIYKKAIKDKIEKKLKIFDKIAFISLYIFGLIFCLIGCSAFINDLFGELVISLIIAFGVTLLMFCTSFFSLFVNRKMSKAFSIVYVPTFFIFFIYVLNDIFYIF